MAETFPGCRTFYISVQHWYMTFHIKWPTPIQLYCSCFLFFEGKGKTKLPFGCLFVFQIYLTRWGSLLTDTPPYFSLLMKRSAESANGVRSEMRWLLLLLLLWLARSLPPFLLQTPPGSRLTGNDTPWPVLFRMLWLSACLSIVD